MSNPAATANTETRHRYRRRPIGEDQINLTRAETGDQPEVLREHSFSTHTRTQARQTKGN